jgi:hypothetical protein
VAPLLRVEHESEPKEIFKRLRPWHLIEGFFQRPDYFETIAEDVRRTFQFESNILKEFRHRHRTLLESPYTAIHVRLTDYLTHGNVMLPMEYYDRRLDSIPKGNTIVWISDDISEVKARYGTDQRFHYMQNDAKTDFMLLQHANELIISNSTFAWWAAYLRIHREARVAAPKYWMGYNDHQEHPKGMMNSDFDWIS